MRTVGRVLRIRPARAEDAEELAALAGAAFRRAYTDLLPVPTVEAVVAGTCTPAAFARLAGAAPDDERTDLLLVAEDGGTLLGFLDFAEDDDGPELRRLYTRADRTSRGIGAALLAELEGRLGRGARYRIVVLAGNERGLRFWLRHGFRTRGRVDGIEHFRTHRGVPFDAAAAPAPLLVLERTVGADPGDEAPSDTGAVAARPGTQRSGT